MVFDENPKRHLKSSSVDDQPLHLPMGRSEELGKGLWDKFCSN